MRNPSRHMPSPLRSLSSSGRLVALVALGGCTGKIGDGGINGGEAGGSGTGTGTGTGSGTGSTGTGTGTGTGAGTTTGGMPPMLCDSTVRPGRAPLRRLTRFEYNNTVRDLLGDTTNPAALLPAEEVGNGFGNDADALSVSSLLAEESYT